VKVMTKTTMTTTTMMMMMMMMTNNFRNNGRYLRTINYHMTCPLRKLVEIITTQSIDTSALMISLCRIKLQGVWKSSVGDEDAA